MTLARPLAKAFLSHKILREAHKSLFLGGLEISDQKKKRRKIWSYFAS